MITPNGKDVSIVTSSQKEKRVSAIPNITHSLAFKGFTGVVQSHTHPTTNVPSGHYGYQEGNSNSLAPIPEGVPGHDREDAANARHTRKFPSFENMKYYVYYLSTNSKTQYDGVSPAQRSKFHN